jgi:hypothetical protein
MTLASIGQRLGRRAPADGATPSPRPGSPALPTAQGRNTIRASQARAARRREALRGEQAVAAWLRELSGRPR